MAAIPQTEAASFSSFIAESCEEAQADRPDRNLVIEEALTACKFLDARMRRGELPEAFNAHWAFAGPPLQKTLDQALSCQDDNEIVEALNTAIEMANHLTAVARR